jgi:chromosome segregation ATPase
LESMQVELNNLSCSLADAVMGREYFSKKSESLEKDVARLKEEVLKQGELISLARSKLEPFATRGSSPVNSGRSGPSSILSTLSGMAGYGYDRSASVSELSFPGLVEHVAENIAAVQSEIRQFDERIKRAEADKSELKDALTRYEASEAASRNSHNEKLKEIRALEDRCASISSERDRLHLSLSKADEDLKFAHQREEANTDMEQICDTLRAELRDVQNTVWEAVQRGDVSRRADNDGLTGLGDIVAEALEELHGLKMVNERLRNENDGNVAARLDAEQRIEIAGSEIDVAREQGKHAAKIEYERIVLKLEGEGKSLRDELDRVNARAERLERECEELRDLCSKLTAQFNSRTNELDDAEEKIAYLQDQVGTLEEDLEEARLHSHARVEESAEARRVEVDRLISELANERAGRDRIDEALKTAQSELESARALSSEAKTLIETHRKAEENLQIALEQLEAEQEFELRRRTASLEKELKDVRTDRENASKLVESAALGSRRLQEQENEIKELREALGRLADERVNLKLELEENLSRLRHPDAGGQLVDRRVVRQLLVSYFRVDSLRRRDVLELMSRMLAFSEEDMITVGIKRRALMDRLGSVVQPPLLGNGLPPPVGSVSEKWIEFLMNESVTEGERDEF